MHQAKQENGVEQAPDDVLRKFRKQTLKRLPITFQPYFHQQINTWNTLFPYERQYLLGVIGHLEQLNHGQESQLFSGIRRVEAEMKVGQWDFSTRDQTLENASLLARSPYYGEWRREEEKVFEQIDRSTGANQEQGGGRPLNRLVLMIFPMCLPFDPQSLWARWPQAGQKLKIDPGSAGDESAFIEALFGAGREMCGGDSRTFSEALSGRSERSSTDVWILDAGTVLSEFLLGQGTGARQPASATVLSYQRLKPFREAFLAELNTMGHSLSSADDIYSQLRKKDFSSLCPPEIKRDPRLVEFVRSLFMSGNGASVWSNPFVEWGAAEVLARARPSVLIGYFGTRDKPKPFTSVAVFENQDVASPLPSVEDFAGSAIDAELLSYYVWLAATRYPEYQNTLIFCLAESLKMGYVTGPRDNPFQDEAQPLTLTRIANMLGAWLT